MLKDSFALAFKNLKHRGVRSWLTLIGIFIGVTAVVALISLGNGLQLAVSSQFGVSQTDLVSVQAGGVSGAGPPGMGVTKDLTEKDLEAIERLSNVKQAVGTNIGSGKLEYNNKAVFGYMTDIPDGEDRKFRYEEIGKDAIAGRLLKDGETGKVFLGYNFYVDKVGLDKEIIPGKKVLINDKEFVVVGILEKKGSFVYDNAVFMNSKDMVDLLDLGDTLDVISVQPKKDSLEQTKLDVEKLMRERRNVKVGEEDFIVSTPEASLGQIKSILTGVQIFIVFVASISIFIGAIGIVNTMTTSVLERKKEIGIMKAIGARNSHIFLQFFIESGLLGLLGGFVGVVFGTLLGIFGVYGINNFIGGELKPSIDFVLIFFALFGSFLIGGLAGIVPAMRAAKQNPVEALRG